MPCEREREGERERDNSWAENTERKTIMINMKKMMTRKRKHEK